MEATTVPESIPSEKDDFLRSAVGNGCDSAQTETLEDTGLGCSCTEKNKKTKKTKEIEGSADGFQGHALSIKNCSPEEGLNNNAGVARDMMTDQNLFNDCHDLAHAEAQRKTELEGFQMKKKRKKKHRKMIEDTCNGFEGDASSSENCSTEDGFRHELGVSSNSIMDQHLLELNNGCDSAMSEAQVNVNLAQVETKRKKKRKKEIQHFSNVIPGDTSSLKKISTEEHLGHDLGTDGNTMTDQHLLESVNHCCLQRDASSRENCFTEEGFSHELGVSSNSITDHHLLELTNSCDPARTEAPANAGLAQAKTKRKKKRQKSIQDTSKCLPGDVSSMKNISTEDGLGHEMGTSGNTVTDQHLLELADVCGLEKDPSSRQNRSTEEGFGHDLGVRSNSIMDQCLFELKNSCDSAITECHANLGSAQVETKRKKKRKKRIQDDSNCILGVANLMKSNSTEEGLGHELGVSSNSIMEQCPIELNNSCDSAKTEAQAHVGLAQTEAKRKMKRQKRIQDTSNCIPSDVSSVKNISTEEVLVHELGVSSNSIIDQCLFKLNNSCDSSRTEAQANAGMAQVETKSKKKKKMRTQDNSNCVPADDSSMKNISTEEGLSHELETGGNTMTDKHVLELADVCCLAHTVNQANKELECSQMAVGGSGKWHMRMQKNLCDQEDALSLKKSFAQEDLDHELGVGTNTMAYQHHRELKSSGTWQISTVSEAPTCSLGNLSLTNKHDFNGNSGLVLTESKSLQTYKRKEKLILHCRGSHDLVDNIVEPVMVTEKASAEPSTELQLNLPSGRKSEYLLTGPYSSNVEAEKNLLAKKINCDRSHNDLAPVGSKQTMENQNDTHVIVNEVNISQALHCALVKNPDDFSEDASTLRHSSAGECLGHEPGVAEIAMADQHLLGMDCIMIGQSILVSQNQSCSPISTSLESNHTCDGNSSIALIENKTTDMYKRKDKSRKSPDLANRSAEYMVGTQKILPETPSNGKACELLESKSERTEDKGYTAKIEIQETILAEKLEYDSTKNDIAPKESKEEVEMDNDVTDIKMENISQVSHISVSRSLATRPSKKLLILDINGLLADIFTGVPRGYQPDLIIPEKSVFKRPYCSYFLQFCFEKFNVGVWSSRAKSNMDRIVYYLFNKSIHKLLFCWDQSHCTKTGFTTVENTSKPLVLKELKKLWENKDYRLPWKRGEYNESNTLLLDDSPYKALRNPVHTAVFPYPYHYRNYRDFSLGPRGDLLIYLEKLANAENVQEFVSQNPFGQRAITESNASWGFYSKIIGPNHP